MTDGINVLTTEEIIATVYPYNWIPIGLFWIGLVLLCITLCILVHRFFSRKYRKCTFKQIFKLPLIILVTSTFFCTTGYGIASQMEGTQISTGRYRYTCTISDEVLYDEILENYNVTGYENGIYTLEDK